MNLFNTTKSYLYMQKIEYNIIKYPIKIITTRHYHTQL
jgi:hypothetical protein